MEEWVNEKVKMVNLPLLKKQTNLPSGPNPRAINIPRFSRTFGG